MAKLYLKKAMLLGVASLALIGITVIAPTKKAPVEAKYIVGKITDTLKCRVLRVKDGDTFEALVLDSIKINVRLSCIDAPEKKQQFGELSKNYLASLLVNQNVKLFSKRSTVDKYNRVIAEVHTDSCFVNLAMVEQGMAFVYYEYCNDPRYNDAEQFAYTYKLGVHSINMLKPWEFRHSK